MLAKPAATLPAGAGMPGGTRWEPKWDGYRAILERTSAGDMPPDAPLPAEELEILKGWVPAP